MLRFASRPLRTKVIAVVLLTTLVALLVSTAALLVFDTENYRTFLIQDAQTQAVILTRAQAPALAFGDRESAQSNLAALVYRRNVIAAAVFDADGKVFATYNRDERAVTLPMPTPETSLTTYDNYLELSMPIIEEGNFLGNVYLRATYGLGDRIRDYSLILGTVMALSLFVALALSLLLAGSVTRPVLDIAAVARRVNEERDFTLRAAKTTDDEVGTLVDAFNAMLGEVDAHAEALRASNDLLRRETRERRSAEAALIAADRRKDEFLATLAHELRNPLAPMVSSVAYLHDVPVASTRAREAIAIMRRQLAHLVRLVEDLLDVSRITSGKLTMQRSPVDLLSIIHDVEDTIRPLVEARGVELDFSLDSEPVYVFADQVRLAQVLANLLNNAIKYSPPGSSISVALETRGETVRIAVSDRGIGMASSTLAHIFDPFFQSDAASQESQSGLGLGLALSKRIVELHDGKIHATSEGLGKGSTVYVELPIWRGQLQQPDDVAEESAAEAGTPARKILLVDDNRDFAASLGLLLRLRGHDVEIADDGCSALQLAADFQPDFGFLDIGLPDINGYSLAKKLRASPQTADIVLVAVSGWGQLKDREQSADAGFALHLIKPVGIQEIEHALAQFS